MHVRIFSVALVAALIGSPSVSEGQSAPPPVRSLVPIEKRAADRDEIPKGYLPPPGMCRIWIDNVPPAQQPAPTDCPSAIKNRPSNGRVIFAEEGRGGRDARGKERRVEKDSAAKKDTTDEDGTSRSRKASKFRST